MSYLDVSKLYILVAFALTAAAMQFSQNYFLIKFDFIFATNSQRRSHSAPNSVLRRITWDLKGSSFDVFQLLTYLRVALHIKCYEHRVLLAGQDVCKPIDNSTNLEILFPKVNLVTYHYRRRQLTPSITYLARSP